MWDVDMKWTVIDDLARRKVEVVTPDCVGKRIRKIHANDIHDIIRQKGVVTTID